LICPAYYILSATYLFASGAKGLDGGYEDRVACRGPSPRKKAETNTNANNELALAA
jgi:hypothetical protein